MQPEMLPRPGLSVDAYRQIQLRLAALAKDLTEADTVATVPATPAWSVKDVYAHLAGAAADILEGNTAGIGSDDWTAAQVDSRRHLTLAEVNREWAGIVPSFLSRVEETGDRPPLVAGTWTHEQDIRGAVGLQGLTSGDGLEVVLTRIESATVRLEAASAPSLRIVVSDREWTLGTGEVEATLSTTSYELARLIYSRRSAEQITALDWRGDPSPFIQTLPVNGPCERSLQV